MGLYVLILAHYLEIVMKREIELVAQYLQERHWRLATAESCTGGLIAKSLTDMAGSSAWFEGGLVTYSNASKIAWLGVAAETLAVFGAVSEEVACEMVEGLLHHSQADLAVAVTGIAGPSGGSAEKPVGTICLAWAQRGQSIHSSTYYLHGDRQQNRIQAATIALMRLIECCESSGTISGAVESARKSL